jgi:hypothetical protein
MPIPVTDLVDLATVLCREVRTMQGNKALRWVPLNKIERRLGWTPLQGEAAARYAAGLGWLKLNDVRRLHSVSLARDGNRGGTVGRYRAISAAASTSLPVGPRQADTRGYSRIMQRIRYLNCSSGRIVEGRP